MICSVLKGVYAYLAGVGEVIISNVSTIAMILPNNDISSFLSPTSSKITPKF